MANIVFIDDDHGPIDQYDKALRLRGHEVLRIDNLAESFRHVRDAIAPPDIYILDMMMSLGEDTTDWPEDFTEQEAGYGMTAGLAIFNRIRAKFPSVKVILLTSVTEPEILEKLPLDQYCTAEVKIRVLPLELADIVNKRLNLK